VASAATAPLLVQSATVSKKQGLLLHLNSNKTFLQKQTGFGLRLCFASLWLIPVISKFWFLD
jgi:hypothetical protein